MSIEYKSLLSRLSSILENDRETMRDVYRRALRNDDIGLVRTLDDYLREQYESNQGYGQSVLSIFYTDPAEYDAAQVGAYVFDKYVKHTHSNYLIIGLVSAVRNDSYRWVDAVVRMGYLKSLEVVHLSRLIQEITSTENLMYNNLSYKELMKAVLEEI